MTYPSNLSNLPGYIGYVQRAYNQGTIDPTQGEGSLQEFPVSFFESYVDVATGIQQNVGGYASWDFGINDVIAGGSDVHLNIALTEQYLNSNIDVLNGNLIGPSDSGFSWGSVNVFDTLKQKFRDEFDFRFNRPIVNFQIVSIKFDELAMSISELSDWYASHPYSAATWQDNAYWELPEIGKFMHSHKLWKLL
jgi:hypothetical protein